MSGVIVFEGDYIRDIDGVVSQIVEFSHYDENGDACCHLANGRVVHTRDLTIDQVLCESEVVL